MKAPDLLLVTPTATAHWRGRTFLPPDADYGRYCAIVFDLPDEQFVLRHHPPLRGRHRRWYLRQLRAESGSGLAHVRSLRNGTTTLLCSLPDEAVTALPLTRIAAAATIPVGFYSLPQLLSSWLPPHAGARLLVHASPAGGWRQCLLRDGELLFSRLSGHAGPDQTPQQQAQDLAQEITLARHHLIADGQLADDEPMTLTLLGPDHATAMATALAAQPGWPDSEAIEVLTYDALAAGANSLPVLLTLRLGQHAPASHYAFALLQRYRIHRTLRLLQPVSLLLACGALIWSVHAQQQLTALQRDTTRLQQQAARLQQHTDSGPPADAIAMAQAIDAYDRQYLRHWPALVPQLKAVSRQLTGLLQLELVRVHWQFDPQANRVATLELTGDVLPPYQQAATALTTLQQRLQRLGARIDSVQWPPLLDAAAPLGPRDEAARRFVLRLSLPESGA